MANTLRFKRGLASGLPTGAAGEPLFTTDTFDLYIGNGSGNTRFQKYIASGSTTQILRGDGSLYTFPLAISSPSNGQVLKYNGTSWVNDSDSGITGSGAAGQVAYFTGSTTQAGSNNLFWDNTNVRLGINTASPQRTLHLVGTGDTYIRVDGQSLQSLFGTDNVGAYIGMQSNAALRFITNASERARIFATGNFGIGTGASDNGLKLQVNGTGYFSGSVGIGTTSLTSTNLAINKVISGSVFSSGASVVGTVQSDVTNTGFGFYAATGTQATVFTLPILVQYQSDAGSFGAGSTITNHIGFRAANISSASVTNAFAFQGTMAAATNRWNLYMSGTANNYMAGSLGIGSTSLTGYNLNVSKNITGAVNGYNITSQGTVQSDVTSTANYFISSATVQNTAFTLPQLYHFRASGASSFGSATVTNQYGFAVNSVLVGATNNYGFYGDIASGTGRWNLYMNGSANNYMAGSLGIGGTGLTEVNLRLSKSITGAANAYAVYQNGQVLSAVTSSGYGFYNTFTTEPTAFTLSNYVHYETYQTTLGAGSTVTNQFGFRASATLTGATNNYGFRGDLAASGTSRWNLYMNGTAPNYLNGELLVGSTSNSGEKLQVNGTMKVTGNVGIGTASDVLYPLKVQRSTAGVGIQVYNSTTYSQIRLQSSGTNQNSYLTFNGTGTGRAIIQVNDTDRLTIDASGNLGLGVTPSAWDTGAKALQIGTRSVIYNAFNGTYFGNNFYVNSTPAAVYLQNGFAQLYSQESDGAHRWYNAPSGIAGATMTLTQAMMLDASGRLGIGTTSPQNPLHIYGTSGNQGLIIQSPDANDCILTFGDVSDLSRGEIRYINPSDVMVFKTANLVEAMRITALQNLHIGTFSSDSGEKLQVTGTAKINTGTSGVTANIATQASGTFVFANNSSSSAVPTLIGKSSNSVGLQFIAATADVPTLGWDMLFDVRETDNTDFTTLTSTAFRFQRSGTLLFDIKRNGNATITGNLTVDTNTLFVDATANEVGIGTTSPNSTLHIEGSVSKQIVAKTANYTATASDHTILCDTTSGGFTITLPTATTCEGRIYVIKKVIGNSGVSNVTIDGNGSETIDGGATLTLQCKSSVMIQSDGANWFILSLYNDTSCL